MSKLLNAQINYRLSELAMQIAGSHAVVWDSSEEERFGAEWLVARVATIAGGTNEMQRNQISERVIGLPREYAPGNDEPFSQVRHN